MFTRAVGIKGWCKNCGNTCLASRKFVQDPYTPRLIACDSVKRDSRRTFRVTPLSVSARNIFIRSFVPSFPSWLFSCSVFPTTRQREPEIIQNLRAMAIYIHERERERGRENEVIRQSNRSERRFNQANGKLEAECCPFFFPLERIQVDYALHTRSTIF